MQRVPFSEVKLREAFKLSENAIFTYYKQSPKSYGTQPYHRISKSSSQKYMTLEPEKFYVYVGK